MTKFLKYVTVFLCLVLLAGLGFCADGEYKNNLLRVTLSKLQSGDVQVSLYMKKLFTEPVSVIRKSDFEYVIMLPDTYHSITSKPALGSAASVVENVDVRLFPYLGSSNNGYTKITIVTSAKTNVIARTFAQEEKQAGTDELASQLETLIAKGQTHSSKPVQAQKTQIKKQEKTVATPKVIEVESKKVEKKKQDESLAKKESVKVDASKTQEKQEGQQADLNQNAPQEENAQTTQEQSAKEPEVAIQEQPTPQEAQPATPQTLPNSSNTVDFFMIFVVSLIFPFLIVVYLVYKLKQIEKNQKTNAKKDDAPQNENIGSMPVEPDFDINPLSGINKSLKSSNEVDYLKQNSDKLFSDYLNKHNEEEAEIDDFEGIELLDSASDYSDDENIKYSVESTPVEEVEDGFEYKVIQEVVSNEPQILDSVVVAEDFGFLIMSYDGEVALIGFIGKDIYSLAKLSLNDPLDLSVKLSERKSDSEVYLVKVGRRKFLCELTTFDIRLIIEL